jgi:NAD(P)H-hydrate epimerase
LVTDGEAIHFNTTGNSGMATAGTGDVLTGLIAALIGQHLEPLVAAATACHLHGLAGDIVARNSSERSLISQDLLAALGQAFNQVESSR